MPGGRRRRRVPWFFFFLLHDNNNKWETRNTMASALSIGELNEYYELNN